MVYPRIDKQIDLIKNSDYENKKFIAKSWLQQAISNRYSEKSLSEYIKFMDSLNKETRDKILLDDEITKLIDLINRHNL